MRILNVVLEKEWCGWWVWGAKVVTGEGWTIYGKLIETFIDNNFIGISVKVFLCIYYVSDEIR